MYTERICVACGASSASPYCADCGAPATAVPEPPKLRSLWLPPPWLVAILAALALGGVVLATVALIQVGALRDDLQRVETDRITRDTAIGHNLDGIRAELQDIRDRLGRSLDAQAIAEVALPSVFKVNSGLAGGSAFVIASGGGSSTLLTNYHVIESSFLRRRPVELERGETTFQATVTATDAELDVAVLHLAEEFPALRANTGDVQQGEPVVVIGNPLGFEGAVSTGIIARIEADVLQLSAAVNPGNSGGPVLDRTGKVVGIATFKAVGYEIEGIAGAMRMSKVCEVTRVCALR